MSDRLLVRVAAIAAVAAGLLRVANSFAGAWLGEHTMAIIFFVEDFLIGIGLLGVYFSRREALGVRGVIGFALGLLGLFTIRSASLFGAAGYQLGAGELLVGLSLLAPPLFLPSLALGLLSLVPALARPAGLLAAIAFGLGFALAGLRILRQR